MNQEKKYYLSAVINKVAKPEECKRWRADSFYQVSGPVTLRSPETEEEMEFCELIEYGIPYYTQTSNGYWFKHRPKSEQKEYALEHKQWDYFTPDERLMLKHLEGYYEPIQETFFEEEETRAVDDGTYDSIYDWFPQILDHAGNTFYIIPNSFEYRQCSSQAEFAYYNELYCGKPVIKEAMKESVA